MSKKKLDSERMRDVSPMGIRLPAWMKERISQAAVANGRSMNAEIVEALEERFPEPTLTQNEVTAETIRLLKIAEDKGMPTDSIELAEYVGQELAKFISLRPIDGI